MTEGRYQYQFDTETETESETPPAITMNEPNKLEMEETQRFLQIMRRLGISILCLLALFYISKARVGWSCWAKRYFHKAINASTGETFGKLLQSQTVRSIMANSRNLLRLETVNRHLRRELSGGFKRGAMINSVWPVQGNLIRRFGWEGIAAGQNPQFSKGIVITGIPGGNVAAIQTGKVVKIDRDPDHRWVLVLEHAEGWRSVYHNLAEVAVRPDQNVQTGDLLGYLPWSPKPDDCRLAFELYRFGRLIDPLSILDAN